MMRLPWRRLQRVMQLWMGKYWSMMMCNAKNRWEWLNESCKILERFLWIIMILMIVSSLFLGSTAILQQSQWHWWNVWTTRQTFWSDSWSLQERRTSTISQWGCIAPRSYPHRQGMSIRIHIQILHLFVISFPNFLSIGPSQWHWLHRRIAYWIRWCTCW